MNPATCPRLAVLCLSLLVFPMSVSAQDEAAETQPATEVETVEATQPDDNAAETLDQPVAEAGIEDISFSIGYTIGSDMTKRSLEVDADQLAAGIRAGLGLEEGRLSEDQIAQCLFSLQMQMQEKQFAQAQESMDQGLAFLNENAKKEGVTVTDSGLQYRVIESGDGDIPTSEDIVAARYRGTLIDGTEFDSSPGDEPVPFPVNRVIPGWVEALQLMKVGDKWELVIPPDLAYGENGTPDGAIAPFSVLIFEIELVEIQ